MTDLNPAFRRLALIAAQHRALQLRRRREVQRLRRIGGRELDRALRPLRLVKGVTILEEALQHDGRLVALGIYRGCAVTTPPEAPGGLWYVEVWLQSVLRSGKPGRHRWARTFRLVAPRDLACRLVVASAAKTGGPRP